MFKTDSKVSSSGRGRGQGIETLRDVSLVGHVDRCARVKLAATCTYNLGLAE